VKIFYEFFCLTDGEAQTTEIVPFAALKNAVREVARRD
jgi:hypothetical protein